MAAKKDRIEIYRSRKVRNQFGWRYVAKNGRKLATCGELYKNKRHAINMVDRLFGHFTTLGAVAIIDTTKTPSK